MDTEFKKLSDMTGDEIVHNFPRCHLKVAREESKYGIRYNGYIEVAGGQLQIRVRLDQASFLVIGHLRNKDVAGNAYEVSFPYRIVRAKSHREDGTEFDYAYVEGYACPKEKKVYLHEFLKGSQLDLLDILKPEGVVDRGLIESTEGITVGYFDDLE